MELKKRFDLKDLSFTCNPDELLDHKKHKEISQTVGKLKGTWKLSYGDKVNYYILAGASLRYLSKLSLKSLLNLKHERMHLWMKRQILKEFEDIASDTLSDLDLSECKRLVPRMIL